MQCAMALHVGVLEQKTVLEVERKRSGDVQCRAACVPHCATNFRECACVSVILDKSQNDEKKFWWQIQDVCFGCDERTLSELHWRER